MKDGDEIVSINGTPVKYFQTFKEELQKYKNKPITLAIMRAGKADTLRMTTAEDGTLGFFQSIWFKNHMKIIPWASFCGRSWQCI
jgi:regulator of sigma E protease